MKTARILAAATLLCTYGMVGCAVYSFAVRESLDLVFDGTLPLTGLCGLLCVVHIVLALRLAGREGAMPLCRLALGWGSSWRSRTFLRTLSSGSLWAGPFSWCRGCSWAL